MESTLVLKSWITFGLLLISSSFVHMSNDTHVVSPSANKYFAEGSAVLPNLGSPIKEKASPLTGTSLNSSLTKVTAPKGSQEESPPAIEPMSIGTLNANSSAKDKNIVSSTLPINDDHNLLSYTVNANNLSVDQLPPLASSNTSSTKDEMASSSVNTSSSLLHTKKKKPGVTYDEEDLPRDENGKIILPEESIEGVGPSFDFVVPIVIAMLAIPFVAVLGAFFYKKARDFWDRRHYRRMDFLIDGMYND